jgi:hypothetical protein
MEKGLEEIVELPDIDTQIEYIKSIRLGMSQKKRVDAKVQMIFAIEQTLLAAKIRYQADQSRTGYPSHGYDLSAILNTYKVRITSARIEILRAVIVCANRSKEFTLSEIHGELSMESLLSKSAVISTVQLYKTRGILRNSSFTFFHESKRRLGRPEKHFQLHRDFDLMQYKIIGE